MSRCRAVLGLSFIEKVIIVPSLVSMAAVFAMRSLFSVVTVAVGLLWGIAGAQAGQKLRLRGRGFPGTPAGDQFVELKIVTPAADTPQAKQAYERMRRDFNFDPRAGWP